MKRVKFVLVREQLQSYKIVGDKVHWRQLWRQGTAAYRKQNPHAYYARQFFMIAALITMLLISLLCSSEAIPTDMIAIAIEIVIVLLITSLFVAMAQMAAIDAQVVRDLNNEPEKCCPASCNATPESPGDADKMVTR
jgi:hypothetical protein